MLPMPQPITGFTTATIIGMGAAWNRMASPEIVDCWPGTLLLPATPTPPRAQDNYYWVSACNNAGCSDIDTDNPAEGWSATDFLARHHAIDGALGIHVRVDPDCTEDCEAKSSPGDGSRDLGAIKTVTGIDLGLMNPVEELQQHGTATESPTAGSPTLE